MTNYRQYKVKNEIFNEKNIIGEQKDKADVK